MFDAAWFVSCFPVFDGLDAAIIEKQIEFAETEVCWAKRCGKHERALALQTAILLNQAGVYSGGGVVSASGDNYDQVIKKHTVGDVTTEFEVIDNRPKGESQSGKSNYQLELDKLKLKCVGSFTNTHVLSGSGVPFAGGGCGC